MVCLIWYRLSNLKKVKKTPKEEFLHFLNCTNGTKSCKASHMLLVLMTVDCFDVPMISISPSFYHECDVNYSIVFHAYS